MKAKVIARKRETPWLIKHGEASNYGQSTEYNTWRGMLRRCHTPSDYGYRNYGARGISVCERWRHDFSTFLSDVGRRPSKRHTLDRINNDGNYEPGNVRWATRGQQAQNRRTTHLVTAYGRTMTVKAWAKTVHLPCQLVYCRIFIYRWAAEKALSTPHIASVRDMKEKVNAMEPML